MAVKTVPDGYHTVTPFLNVKKMGKLMDFLKAAFGAEEIMRMAGPDGAPVHAEMSIGNSRIMLGEIMEQNKPSASYFYIYVGDADAMFTRAIGAGATSVSQPEEKPWGDRMGTVTDPFGNTWSVATHKEDVTPEELTRRIAKMGH
jgi:PhnB protein